MNPRPFRPVPNLDTEIQHLAKYENEILTDPVPALESILYGPPSSHSNVYSLFNSLFGQDAQLLDTRCLVLEQAGFRVHKVLTLFEAKKTMRESGINIVLICHSVSMQDCNDLAGIAEVLDSRVKILALTAGRPAYTQPSLNVFEGPRRLIEEVNRLCGSQEATSTQAFAVGMLP